jgi:hypothetical protein
VSRFTEADRLLRLIVSQRERCERCGGQGSQVAHILRRGYHATRCDEQNVWWLCGGPGSNGCHETVDNNWPEFNALVVSTIGEAEFSRLRDKAHAGPGEPLSVFWPAERARLRERCRELGIPLRGAA